MNTHSLDSELVDIDQEPESWPDMLNNMFDEGDITIIEVNDNEVLE
jgi:hypothetical protein